MMYARNLSLPDVFSYMNSFCSRISPWERLRGEVLLYLGLTYFQGHVPFAYPGQEAANRSGEAPPFAYL